MTDIDSLLPNPFLHSQTDILFQALEEYLDARPHDHVPLFIDDAFMQRLEAAVIAAGDTPLRETQSRRLVARLRQLR